MFLFVPICYFICQCQDHAHFYMLLPPFNTLIFFYSDCFCLFSFLFVFYDSPSHNKIHELQAAGFVMILLLRH